jgi:hypothetical protein
MDWDLLRIFLTVAREGQILSAARKMGLNHATVRAGSMRWKRHSIRACSIGGQAVRC